MAEGDLTTLAALQAFLRGQVVLPTADEPLVEGLISAVSAEFKSETGSEILTAAYSEARNGNGRATLFLRQFPVISVQGVEVNGTTIPARPSTLENGWVLADASIGRLQLVGSVFSEGVANVVVQYRAGYGTAAPADVSQAIVDQVAYLYRMKDRIGIANESQNGTSTTYLGAWTAQQGKGGKTPLYLAAVDRYRRVA